MSLPAAATPDLPAIPPSPPDPHGSASARPESPEELIYEGPVSLWMGWRALLVAGLACGGGLAGLLCGFFQAPSLTRQILVVIGGALAAAGGLMVPYLVFSIRSLRYKITTRLIEREKGLLVKRVDSLDLGRVRDVELRQSLLQRLLRLGTLELYSSDVTDPVMRIEDIPNPRPAYEKLRNAVIALAQRRGVMPLDH